VVKLVDTKDLKAVGFTK